MGKFSRSLSRVQPIFKALYEIDPSGEGWVRSLLDMASGNDSFSSAISEISLGTLVKPPQFEFPVDPSKTYLKWLFEHPEILSSPPAKAWKSWATKTQAMRSRFLLGDKKVQTLAISNIENCTSLPKTAWWRLEGATYVDCALLTDSAVIFVEGKITETGPSKEVIWYHGKNQIHHKLDCAAVYAREEGLRHYFVIAIFDNELMQQGPFRRREVDALMSFDVISKSLPHLNNDELKEIARHFAGVTTWEEIIDRFGLRNRILPHPINHP